MNDSLIAAFQDSGSTEEKENSFVKELNKTVNFNQAKKNELKEKLEEQIKTYRKQVERQENMNEQYRQNVEN